MTTLVAPQIPAKMAPFAREPKRHKIARGGRGSAKSWSIARIKIYKAMARRQRILCVREVQKSIRQSVARLIETQLEALGVRDWWNVTRDSIDGPHGSTFWFTGLQDHTADSLRSFEGFDGAWVTEAHSITENSANILIPTIRNEGSEIWWDYNPNLPEDYIHKMADTPDDDTLVIDMNWRDNPFFPAVLEKERLKLQRLNTALYEHVWEGRLRSKSGVVFKRNWFRWYEPTDVPRRMTVYMACDYAGAPDEESGSKPDWTEFGVFGLDANGNVYVLDWWFGQEDAFGDSEDESSARAATGWLPAAVKLVQRWKPQRWFEEKGVILRTLNGTINRYLQRERAWIVREGMASAGNKAERAMGFAGIASQGSVYLPRGVQWADRLLEQLCAFTGQAGRQDDAVDVCSLFARAIGKTYDAATDEPAKEKPIVPFSKEWLEYADRVDAHEAERRARYYR